MTQDVYTIFYANADSVGEHDEAEGARPSDQVEVRFSNRFAHEMALFYEGEHPIHIKHSLIRTLFMQRTQQ